MHDSVSAVYGASGEKWCHEENPLRKKGNNEPPKLRDFFSTSWFSLSYPWRPVSHGFKAVREIFQAWEGECLQNEIHKRSQWWRGGKRIRGSGRWEWLNKWASLYSNKQLFIGILRFCCDAIESGRAWNKFLGCKCFGVNTMFCGAGEICDSALVWKEAWKSPLCTRYGLVDKAGFDVKLRLLRKNRISTDTVFIDYEASIEVRKFL